MSIKSLENQYQYLVVEKNRITGVNKLHEKSSGTYPKNNSESTKIKMHEWQKNYLLTLFAVANTIMRCKDRKIKNKIIK